MNVSKPARAALRLLPAYLRRLLPQAPCFARCANGGVNGCDEKREGKARMIHIVGAGSGAADLITLRGARLRRAADGAVRAGSPVNIELLGECN